MLPCACDDADACTVGEICILGQCIALDGFACDDVDPCTTDACDRATGGCLHEAVTCDDAQPFTADACEAGTGVCLHVPIVPAPVSGVQFANGFLITWDPSGFATAWNTYRGTIPPELMRSPGRRNPYDHLCFESADLGGNGPTTSSDPTVPPLGSAFYTS